MCSVNDAPWEEQLVLICGPPCTGKTALAQQHVTHQRLSFEAGAKVVQALGSKAKLVKRELSKGQVCLDDQHEGSSYRKNMIAWSTAQQAHAPKQALCVWCEPLGGRTQCIWANEWNMVAANEAGAVGSEYMPLALTEHASAEAYGSKHKRFLESWFPSGSGVVPKPPSEGDLLAEGFHRVLPMSRLPLCPQLHGTFHRVGLVIDAHAVLEDRSPAGGTAQPRALCQLREPASSPTFAAQHPQPDTFAGPPPRAFSQVASSPYRARRSRFRSTSAPTRPHASCCWCSQPICFGGRPWIPRRTSAS